MLCLGYDGNTDNTTRQGLMAPQRSSLRTLSSIIYHADEIKESVITTEGHRSFVGRPISLRLNRTTLQSDLTPEWLGGTGSGSR